MQKAEAVFQSMSMLWVAARNEGEQRMKTWNLAYQERSLTVRFTDYIISISRKRKTSSLGTLEMKTGQAKLVTFEVFFFFYFWFLCPNDFFTWHYVNYHEKFFSLPLLAISIPIYLFTSWACPLHQVWKTLT